MPAPTLSARNEQLLRPIAGLNYATVWRWHFYAGLLCLPMVIWLAVTGSLYLFKPQIDAWIDRPFQDLPFEGPTRAPSEEVHAALATIPGSVLDAYELPRRPHDATQVLIGRGSELYRVYVHPQDLRILKIISEDHRLTKQLFLLHGELMLGSLGSMLVELAASWAIVLILTGLYLWWPDSRFSSAGLLYPRLTLHGRSWWRDLHVVAGFWISAFTLFLLISGLPWAKSWGGMLKDVRQWSASTTIHQDWTTGSQEEAESRAAAHRATASVNHRHSTASGALMSKACDAELDRVVPLAAHWALAAPVLVLPPGGSSSIWTVRSDAQKRPARAKILVHAPSGEIVLRETFAQRPLIDRLIGYGVAIHEGQMFGWVNQLLGAATALGLLTVCVSGAVMWIKRKPANRLGAPPTKLRFKPSLAFALSVFLLGIALPLFGLSLLLILMIERWLFVRLPRVALFLGLQTSD